MSSAQSSAWQADTLYDYSDQHYTVGRVIYYWFRYSYYEYDGRGSLPWKR